MEHLPTTSATRQGRRQWFSVYIFPLSPEHPGIDGNRTSALAKSPAPDGYRERLCM
jgi:hypothetical protein